MRRGLFSDVCWIIRTLKARGHRAFIAGGAVRDLLMGRAPQDYDIATTASPEEVLALFPRAKKVGKSFGTLLLVLEHRPYQVTTLQTSGGTFTTSLRKDILRRDFTVNTMFWDPLEDSLIDIVGGMKDMRARMLSPVTTAEKVFQDDPIRMLRAIRLAHSLGFSLHPSIPPAIRTMKGEIRRTATERIQSELVKILSLNRVLEALCPMVKSRIFFEIFPEMASLRGLNQSPHHDFSALSHTFRTVARGENLIEGGKFLEEPITAKKHLIILSALFHDIGKPATASLKRQAHHFYGHEVTGAQTTLGILKRLRFPKRESVFVKYLVERHMYPLHLFRLKESGALSERAVQRFRRKIKKEALLPLLLLSTADQFSKRRHTPERMAEKWLAFCRELKGNQPI